MADENEQEIEKQKRNKEELQSFSPTAELGSVGIQNFNGVIDEDFLDDLSGREKLTTYKEMSKNDAIVSAILYAIDQLTKQVKWHVRPVSNDQADQEAAEFLRQCMEDMEHSWETMIGQINNRHIYGFAPMEQVYKQRNEENSQFADGRIGWKKIEIRRPDTMWEWIYDDDEVTLLGMRQQNPSTFNYTDIPIEKLLNFTVQGEGGSPEGESLLRGAYRSWYYKKKLEEIEAIGIERDATGIPVVELPPEFFAEDADEDQKSILRQMESLAQDIRNNENAGVTMPRSFDENGNQRFNLKLLESPGDGHTDITETLEQKRQEIATSLLSDFLLLGQSDQVGSFALSRDKTSMFSLAIESLLDDIQGKFNKKGIPKLFALNDFDVDELPKIEHDDIRKEDVSDIGSTLKDIANAGARPFADDDQNELLNSILKQMNLPTVEEQQGPGNIDIPDTQMQDVESSVQKSTHGQGDWVKWSSAGGTAHGKIDDVVREGCTTRGKGDVEVCAEEGDPVVVIEVYDDESGESQNELVRHKMSTVNSWDGPSMEKQVDTVPTQEMADNASQALDKYNDDELDNDQCGTQVGIERANQLENQEELSEETINRMVSFFSRHEGDEEINEGVDNKWEDCGYLTWQFWGGDAGFDWAQRKQEQFGSDDS